MKKQIVLGTLCVTILLILAVYIPLFPARPLQETDNALALLDDHPSAPLGEKETVPPSITITFAGNLLDRGGPYYIPPFENGTVCSDGYFTNDSRQSERSMLINCLVTDVSGVSTVWLQWLNETKWTNWTYKFRRTLGDNWQFNTQGQIRTTAGYRYSFNVVANDTSGNSRVVFWNKTGLNMNGAYTRRYVQLNNTPQSIEYTPFYFYGATYSQDDCRGTNHYTYDRFHHDQGADGTITDTGYLRAALPSNQVSIRYCSWFAGFWFDETVCIQPFTLTNIYYHFWYASNSDEVDHTGWRKDRRSLEYDVINYYIANYTQNRSSQYYNNGLSQYSDDYFLDTRLLPVTSTSFTDNNIYELAVNFRDDPFGYPSIINNRSIISFVLFNVPNNKTLNETYGDSDQDGLSDWTELYHTYTHPFLSDTDNDGFSDFEEHNAGTDPNNYQNHPTVNLPPYVPSNPNPANGATGVDINADLSWTGGDPDVGDSVTYDIFFGTTSPPPKMVSNQTGISYALPTLSYNTRYYWKIVSWDNHGASTVGSIWSFTTMLQPNNPPYVPSNPSPANGASGVDINADLSWTGGDPDVGDTVTYDVFFGTVTPPPKIASNQSGTSYALPTLVYNTRYYWKIVSWDNHGVSTPGSIWTFVTMLEPNNPPYIPSNPNPPNQATGIDINADLSWTGGDPDSGDTVKYDVFFGTSSPPPKIVGNQSATTYNLPTLLYNTRYYWKIVSWDNHGVSTPGPIWTFVTMQQPNNPPNIPSNPNPSDGAINININADISWTGGDPDAGDTVTYDVFFSTVNPPQKVASNQSGTMYDPGPLSYSSTYYWKIVSWDNHGVYRVGPIWSFTTVPEPNNPPYVPSNPTPADQATDIDINADISWTGGDPDPGDTVTYDIFFGKLGELNEVITAYPLETYDPGTLAYETTYYWYIISHDNHGAETIGPVWNFTTVKETVNLPPSPPTLMGPSSGTIGVEYVFSMNATDPEGNQVLYNLSWGDGNDTDWLGPYASGETIDVPYIWTTQGIFEVKVKAKDVLDAESDWSESLSINISYVKHIEINNIKVGYLYFRFFSDKSYAYINLLDLLGISVVFGFDLDVNATVSNSVNSVEFNITRLFTGEQTTEIDEDMTDGATGFFTPTTGLFSIAAHAYDVNGTEIGNQTIDFVIFIKPNSGAGPVNHLGSFVKNHITERVKMRSSLHR